MLRACNCIAGQVDGRENLQAYRVMLPGESGGALQVGPRPPRGIAVLAREGRGA